jgi:hypothetical protein
MRKLVWDTSAILKIKEPNGFGYSPAHSLWKFRYPPHWTLFAMESVAAAGSFLAFVAAIGHAREYKRHAAQR